MINVTSSQSYTFYGEYRVTPDKGNLLLHLDVETKSEFQQ